nr:MAG TPA: hypothetical protein [Caudoviricetes sp.]
MTQQIKSIQHKTAVIKRQRDTYALLLSGLFGYLVVEKAK